jgi:uncharacterized protein YfaS (alpha-2-macroglobulin family)
MSGYFSRSSGKNQAGGQLVLSDEQIKWVEQARAFGVDGLTRIRKMKNPDGSFGWFGDADRADPSMTLLVLARLAAVDSPVMKKELSNYIDTYRWLNQHIPQANSPQGIWLSYIGARFNETGVLVIALPEIEARLRFQGEYVQGSVSLEEKALYLLALKGMRVKDQSSWKSLIKPVVAQLRDEVQKAVNGSEPLYAANWSPGRQVWRDFPGMSTSGFPVAAHALYEYGEVDANLRAAITAKLLSTFNGAHFGSTFETSRSLTHAAWMLLAEAKELSGKEPPEFQVNGGKQKPSGVRQVLGGWEIDVPATAFITGKNSVTLAKASDYPAARVVVDRAVPYAKARPAREGFQIVKKVYKVDEKTGQLTELSGGKVQVGDLLFSRLTFQGLQRPKRGWWASVYSVLSDDVPAGFQPVEEDHVYEAEPYKLPLREKHAVKKVARADRIEWYFKADTGWMDHGTTVGYLMRAAYAGTFRGGIARVEDFYDESAHGQTAPVVYTIVPSARASQ